LELGVVQLADRAPHVVLVGEIHQPHHAVAITHHLQHTTTTATTAAAAAAAAPAAAAGGCVKVVVPPPHWERVEAAA
jgi:hypothetical protein